MKLTANELEAVKRILAVRADQNNYGMMSHMHVMGSDQMTVQRGNIKIEGKTITKNGEPVYTIQTRYAAHKTQGCYNELLPKLSPV